MKPEADHRLRHRRFIRQHLHDLDLVQKAMKRQLNELNHHRIGDRLHNLESEQKRLANANFNMSRQVASLDRLHGSMLELLEDIEGIQNKFDKTIPDIKREISKVEFNAAQVASEYGLLREEGHNAAKSIQALAVSVSTLQDNRDEIKQLEQTVNELKHNFTKVRAGAYAHRHMFHKRIEKVCQKIVWNVVNVFNVNRIVFIYKHSSIHSNNIYLQNFYSYINAEGLSCFIFSLSLTHKID